MASLGILILAGGEATRLPGKLLLPIHSGSGEDVPMLVRVLQNMRAPEPREIVISGKSTFPPALDAQLDVPLVIDRWPGRGPLAGMLSAMARMRSRYVFAVAGDAPNLSAAFANDLMVRAQSGDEAVCPRHVRDGRIEPLASVYDRLAFLRHGLPVLRSGRGSLRSVLDRMNVRYVAVEDEEPFANINTSADFEHVRREAPMNFPTPR